MVHSSEIGFWEFWPLGDAKTKKIFLCHRFEQIKLKSYIGGPIFIQKYKPEVPYPLFFSKSFDNAAYVTRLCHMNASLSAFSNFVLSTFGISRQYPDRNRTEFRFESPISISKLNNYSDVGRKSENYFNVKIFSDSWPKSAQNLILKVFSDSRTQIICRLSEFFKD